MFKVLLYLVLALCLCIEVASLIGVITGQITAGQCLASVLTAAVLYIATLYELDKAERN